MNMERQYYDIIGDIHGHANELIKLLQLLGYADAGDGYAHPERKVVFLGDFIDRGEHLRQHRKLLALVMKMVRNGHALAVMGNHEFNALAFHTLHQGEYLRRRSEKNIRQHQAFLNEFESEPELKKDVLAFFHSLPLWLELDGLRVIHACWHHDYIDIVRARSPSGLLDLDMLIDASTEGHLMFAAVETLIKGVEIGLPDGIVFHDKDGAERDAIRVQWWRRDAKTLGEVALPIGLDIGAAAQLPAPQTMPRYGEEQPPCFVGHYWLAGEPEPLASNVACLDYSVAKQGKLVAYRWSGESVLRKENFVHA
ncbi:diadenosine tetraphosphatase [Hahella sp. KA22]|nr:diadenosine tetraphosphatase [Hahella sp. KA22]QAY54757.1 diadenosine tetraphosphatase [Hahella sp. KA22]